MMPKIRIAVALLLCGFALQSCENGSDDTGELRAEIERLENVVANQRLLLEYHGGLSFEGIDLEDSITDRHLIISLWYLNPELGNYYIGRAMGHEWGPRWKRRSPVSILEEQTRVMRSFLKETRALEDSSAWPRTYPTEKDVAPSDGARIDWENFIEKDGKRDSPPTWFGRNAKSGNWMVFQHGKGVSKPSSEQLTEIEKIKAEEQEAGDPFD